MTFDLSFQDVVAIVGAVGGGFFSLWMKSMSEQSNNLRDKLADMKEELDGLRDALQNTRENYVTNQRFDKFTETVFKKLDAISDKIDLKNMGTK